MHAYFCCAVQLSHTYRQTHTHMVLALFHELHSFFVGFSVFCHFIFAYALPWLLLECVFPLCIVAKVLFRESIFIIKIHAIMSTRWCDMGNDTSVVTCVSESNHMVDGRRMAVCRAEDRRNAILLSRGTICILVNSQMPSETTNIYMVFGECNIIETCTYTRIEYCVEA